MSDVAPEGKPERIDFSEQANRAAESRLAGDLETAESIYYEIAELGSAGAEGYAEYHLGLCSRTRGDQADAAGMAVAAEDFYGEASMHYDRAFLCYFEAGDWVRASAAMLDRGVLSLRQGRPNWAVERIIESIEFLRSHADEEPDRGFVDEHLGIKYARLAEADLAAGDIALARAAINRAEATPQRNPYFVMVATEINGYVHKAEGNLEAAEDALTTAALKADAQGDLARKRRILAELDTLRD